MPKTPKTDLQVLAALLSMPVGKLTPHEQQVFQGMYDNLAAGRVVKLSMRQRAWADEVYDTHDLDKERPAARKVAVKDRYWLPPVQAHPLSKLDHPLKPPGRT